MNNVMIGVVPVLCENAPIPRITPPNPPTQAPPRLPRGPLANSQLGAQLASKPEESHPPCNQHQHQQTQPTTLPIVLI